MVKAIKAAAVTLGFIGLWAPAIQGRLRLVHYAPLNENRYRAPRPTDWSALISPGMPFAKKYEDYFNDGFGFRDLLIRIKHQIDYSVFRESDEVVVGRDGWLAYKSVVNREQYDLDMMPASDLARLLERLNGLRARLSARGITLVIVPCPMKDEVYPEILPPGAPRRPSFTTFDRYRAYLREHPEFVLIDALSILRGLKGGVQVFHKTDFHWTDPAAAHVAKALVNELGALSGSGPLWDQPMDVAIRPWSSGGEGAAMGLLWPVVEPGWFLKEDEIRHPPMRFHQEGPNEWTLEATAPAGPLLPTTVVFGDSFADGFNRAGMAAYFAHLQKFDAHSLGHKIGQIPPDTRFVVFEHIEQVLLSMTRDDFWPEP